MKMKTELIRICEMQSALRKNYDTECIYQNRRSEINNLTFYFRNLGKEQKIKSKVRREEIIREQKSMELRKGN